MPEQTFETHQNRSETPTLLPWSQEWYDHQVKQLGEAACSQLGFYPIPDSLLLSVVIPVYNEEATLEELVNAVSCIPVRKEIILVDDGSKDSSPEIIQFLANNENDSRTRIRHLLKKQNQGKGAAIVSGFEMAEGDIVIIQDADLEYDPREYPSLIRPIVEGKADVVFGSRFLGDHAHRVLYFWHYLGNRFLTTLSNCFTNLNLTDMESCYKVMRREVVQALTPTLQQKRFGIEPELTAKIARRNYAVYEMSISYSGRTYAEGKKIGWRDGVNALWCIVRYGLAD